MIMLIYLLNPYVTFKSTCYRNVNLLSHDQVVVLRIFPPTSKYGCTHPLSRVIPAYPFRGLLVGVPSFSYLCEPIDHGVPLDTFKVPAISRLIEWRTCILWEWLPDTPIRVFVCWLWHCRTTLSWDAACLPLS